MNSNGSIRIDIVEPGETISAAKMLGIVPETHELDDFNLYVRTVGSTVIVYRSDSDETIVKAVGFANTMQKLANHYNLPVVVAADPGVKVTAKIQTWLGSWQPSNPVVSRVLATQDDNGERVMVRVGSQVAAKSLENSPVYVIEAFTGMDTIVRDVATGLRAKVEDIRYVVPGYLTVVADGYIHIPTPVLKHAYGRSAMLCGVDMGESGSSVMANVTCPDCRDALVLRASSGERITQGMAVYDYDLNLGTVDLGDLDSDGWFHVVAVDGGRRSLMNGVRVTTRHPSTRMLAADAVAALARSVNPLSEGDCGNPNPHRSCGTFQCAGRTRVPAGERAAKYGKRHHLDARITRLIADELSQLDASVATVVGTVAVGSLLTVTNDRTNGQPVTYRVESITDDTYQVFNIADRMTASLSARALGAYLLNGELSIEYPTLPAPVADGCPAGFRHEPSYRFVISSHNGIDFGTCGCGELIQGNKTDGYRPRADVVAEKARERAAVVEAGFPAVGDWLHHDPSGTTGRVTLINSAGRLTVDFGDGRPRSAHWDVFEGEGFELIESSPVADELMTYGQAFTPGRDSVPAPVGRMLSKPNATKINRRKRKSTKAGRARTGGKR